MLANQHCPRLEASKRWWRRDFRDTAALASITAFNARDQGFVSPALFPSDLVQQCHSLRTKIAECLGLKPVGDDTQQKPFRKLDTRINVARLGVS